MFEYKKRYGGAVKICVSDGWIERFINRCLQEGIALWQIETDGKVTTLWLRLADYRRLRPIVRDSHVRIRITARRGCPFVVRRIRRRKGLVIGPILFGLLFYVCTLFVWQVEVVGNHTVETEEILALAKAQNISVGAWRSSVRARQAQEAIVANCGQLVWCGVYQEGSRVTIEVVEKTQRHTDTRKGNSVTAGKDGILTELIVLRGTAVKAVGDTVKQGEVLIEGVEPVYDGEDSKKVRPVGARGIARARVWYEGYGKVSLETIEKERTGNTAYGLTIQAGETVFDWQSEKISRFTLWETEKTTWQWRNQIFPVEIITDIYYECEPIAKTLSVEEATALAAEEAWQSVAQRTPKDAHLKDKRLDVLSDTSAGMICTRAWAETEEEIGVYSDGISETDE